MDNAKNLHICLKGVGLEIVEVHNQTSNRVCAFEGVGNEGQGSWVIFDKMAFFHLMLSCHDFQS